MGLPAEAAPIDQANNHLWVTFARDGKPIGQVVSATGQVRWGPSLGIEFSYPVSGLQTRETLFASGRGGARLLLLDGMAGELRSGNSRVPLEDLEDWGLVKGRGKRRWVQLTPWMEGWIVYRGVTIGFRYGPAPARDQAPRLGKVPRRFRRGLLDREERPFAVLTWVVYGVFFYIVFNLGSMPLPDVPRPERVAKRFAKLIYEARQAPTRARSEILKKAERDLEEAATPEEPPEPEPEPAPEPEPKPEPEPSPPPETSKAAPEPEPVEQTPPPSPPVDEASARAAKEPRRSREEIRKSVAKKGLLGLLAGRGTASTSRTKGSILEGKGAAGDLDRVLENVKGLRAAPTGKDVSLGSDAPGGPVGIDDAARQAAMAPGRVVELEERKKQKVEAPEEVELDALTLKEAVAAIHRTVGTYLGGIRYLYNRELRKNPDLEGKLTVSITISPEGIVTECAVVESTLGAPKLAQAVLKRIRKWKFPQVAPRPVTVTYPFVFFPSM